MITINLCVHLNRLWSVIPKIVESWLFILVVHYRENIIGDKLLELKNMGATIIDSLSSPRDIVLNLLNDTITRIFDTH